MCNEATRIEPYPLPFVPDCSKAQEMCDKAIQIDPFTLRHVPDNLKTQELCIRGADAGLGLLEFIPDWFVTQQQMSVAMMINLLNGTMVIKNGRPKKQKQ